MTPLRVHSEEELYEHLMLSMIAATINIMVMGKMKMYHENREKMYMTLVNQKCLVYRTQVNTCEPQSSAQGYYEELGIQCPLYLKRYKEKPGPQYYLEKR